MMVMMGCKVWLEELLPELAEAAGTGRVKTWVAKDVPVRQCWQVAVVHCYQPCPQEPACVDGVVKHIHANTS